MFGRRKIFRIIKIGNPILRRTSVEIPKLSDDVLRFAEILLDTMYENNGLGLAAPQIGINLKIIAIHIPKAENQKEERVFPFTASPGELMFRDNMPVIFVNPKIILSGNEECVIEEGCLSIPKVFDKVRRPSSVTLNTLLLSGEEVTVECGGMLARALQHEIDHLNGVLFTDYLSQEQLRKHKKSLEQIEKSESALLRKGLAADLIKLAERIVPGVTGDDAKK